MDISEIPHKANARPVTNRLHQLDAEEFNAMLDELINLRSLVGDSGVVYSVRLQNNLDSRNLSASVGNPCILAFTYISRMRDGLSDWEQTGESAMLTVSVKNSSNENFIPVKTMKVNDSTAMTLDVSEWLVAGSNQVMLEATGEISTKTTAAMAYTIQLTSLAISAEGFEWWNAYAEDFRIPFRIAGNVSKTLVVTVTGNGYSKTYESELGTMTYTESPYNYSVAHPKRTGVFKISAYLRNADGTIRTVAVAYNVICYLQGATSKLMAVNNVADHAVNWNETAVFDYSVFEGAATTTAVTFNALKDGKSVFKREEYALPTNTKHTLTLPLEVETIDDVDFNIVINALNGEYSLMSPLTLKVLNSLGYSPTAGAAVYINPRTRSNSEANRHLLINEVDGSTFAAVWHNPNWYNDGHTKDAEGNSILRMMAGSWVDTGITPLKPESARTGKLIELDYRVSNVTDFDTPIIECYEPHMGSFVGFKVYPDRVVVHTAAQKVEDNQSFKFNTEDRMHLAIAVMPDIYGNTGFNLCKLFVDGVVNREFSYASNDYFLVDSTLKIGSEYADVDIYGIRVYNNSISADGVHQNNVSWRATNEEKALLKARNDVYDASGIGIDFDKVRALANVIVFEGSIPSKRNPGKFRNNWDVLWRDHPEWDIFIKNIVQDSQGTSAKEYDDHNQRGTADSGTTWSRRDGTSGAGAVPYIPGLPAIRRWTNKINWASSCGCNKQGSVNSIHELCVVLDLLNEVKSRAAIWQEPFVGFQRSYNEEGAAVYTYLGLFTGGPDKGDLASLGLDTDAYPDLLFVEGADNAAPGALFKVPWNPKKGYWKYNADEESMQYNGINCWDYDGGAPKVQADVQDLYERVWMPRYNFVYQCSHNLSYWPGTVEDLNSNENLMRYKDADVEFWVDGGDVYYYEAAEGKFIPSDIGEGTINLFGQLVDKGYGLTSSIVSGKSNAELNELFRAARVMKFSLEAPAKFNKRASIFSRNWMEFYAGSDNRTKNTYFIMLGEESDGYLCSLFWDDTDTIGPWTNQGQDKKGYWVEVGDKYDNGQPVWNGEQNRFYNLIEMAWAEDIRVEMHAMMTAMITLSGSETGNSSDRLYAFFHKYYFAKAQEYFPEVLYNAAARVMYEDAKLAYIEGTYTNDTDPITQSMGNYYSGWKRWIKYRIQYMQSKYAFGDYAATGGDSIVVRASGNDITYDIIPAIWMYPCVANGTSIVRGERTKAGEVCQITVSLGGSADQQNHIKGAHFLQSIGGWWNKNVTGAMIVVGRMLRELRIGHETEDIVISIDTLTVKDTPSLQLLDVRRVATLAGVLDLSACTHLRYAYAGGTSVTQIALPGGGPLQHIEYSALNQYLILRNFPLLKSEGVVISECLPVISGFLIENCSGLNPIDLLRSILAAQASQTVHSLKRVRAVGFNETYDTDGSAVLDDLAKLADGSYVGLDSSGLAGSDPYPVLDGELTINTFCYEDSVLALRQIFTRLTINISGGFYLRFADPEVQRILISNGVGDGTGITKEATEKVTNIGTWFKGNTTIEHFDEFEKFTGVTFLGTRDTNPSYGAFNGCTNLKSISLPKSCTTLKPGAFQNCSSLAHISGLEYVKTIGFNAASNALISQDLNLSSFEGILGYNSFSGTSIKNIVSLGKCTELRDTNSSSQGVFYNCKELQSVNIPSTLATIGRGAFYGCDNLTTVNGDLSSVETIGYYAFADDAKLSGDFDFPNLVSLNPLTFTRTSINSFSASKLESIIGTSNGGSSAFYGCKNLKSVNLPSVILIERETFSGCTSLEDVNIPNITDIRDNVFYNTSSLKSIYAPKLTSVSSRAFSYSGITDFDAPNISEIAGVSSGLGVFQGCTNLSRINIGNIKKIGGNAFYGCTSLEIEELNLHNLEELGQNVFNGVKIKKMVLGKEGGSLTLPSASSSSQNYGSKSVLEIIEIYGTTTINPNSFYNYKSLSDVVIPNIVASIMDYAFYGCSSLKNINLNHVQNIAQKAFMNSGVVTVKLDNVITIGINVFQDCKSLESVVIGESYTGTGGAVFYGCSSLKTLIVKAITPPEIGGNMLTGANSCIIYVPDASVTAYREASGWSAYADRIKPLSEYVEE